jgi:predicted DNA-binding transcriptional regulator AlpA
MPSHKRRKSGKPRPVAARPEVDERKALAATARAAKSEIPFIAKPPPPDQPRRFVYKAELLERLGVSFPSIWTWMRKGLFPLSIDLNGRTAWFEHEIEQWLDERPRRQQLPLPTKPLPQAAE